MQTSLQGIAQKAKEQKHYRFRNLYGMLNEDFLLDSWKDLNQQAAKGLDGIDAQTYQTQLQKNIEDLVNRLKQKNYQAQGIRRQMIPKANGKLRPLGIVSLDDKLLQIAAARLLETIYEEDFLACSFGYRRNKGALEAVKHLQRNLQFGSYQYVVEADIHNFFGSMSHQWIERMLQERVDDQAFQRLIQKWLRADIWEAGQIVEKPEQGTVQGGNISPVLSNIYLHYVLDLWFEKVMIPHMKGRAQIIRYADDFVCLFQTQQDAQWFYDELPRRLEKFNLQLAMEKTRILKFRDAKASFNFLGFEYRWGKYRSGSKGVKLRTARKKLRGIIQEMKKWCKDHRHLKFKEQIKQLNTKLQGLYNYFGVIGNYKSLQIVYDQVVESLYHWLNRRSQKRSYNWKTYKEALSKHNLRRPRIVEQSKKSQAIQIQFSL